MELFAAFDSDAYKLGHGLMYSEGTNLVYSNLTPRTDKIHRRNATKYYDGKLVFFGAQGAIKEIVENWEKFFAMDKGIAIARFQNLCDFMLGEGSIPTDALEKLHDIGYLPLEIKTLDEGDKVPMGVPVMTIRNTVDHAYWLVNFLETSISNSTWKQSTTATIAAEYKSMLTDFAVRTGCDTAGVVFQGHDFSSRGMSGREDAARAGMGHLTSFLGTDSLGSIMYAQQYYNAGNFVGASVPATEHAVATSNILRIERALNQCTYEFKSKRQREIYDRMTFAMEDKRLIAEMMFLYELMLKFPTGILSYVTDSFDFWGVLKNGLPYLKDVIMERDGKLVIRPDSGDPVEVVCGLKVLPEGFDLWEVDELDCDVFKSDDKFYRYELEYGGGYGDSWVEKIVKGEEVSDVEVKGAVQVLYELFGGKVNDKGYIELADCIGLIYGDSITTQRCLNILTRLEKKGYASNTCVFGVGSFTYQCVTRDTFGFAVKATYTEVDGEGIAIFKDPKTDSKKKSAKGLLYVARDVKDELYLSDNVTSDQEESTHNLLTTRFIDGQFRNQTTLEAIRSKL